MIMCRMNLYIIYSVVDIAREFPYIFCQGPLLGWTMMTYLSISEHSLLHIQYKVAIIYILLRSRECF
jgi:hypothetical protein